MIRQLYFLWLMLCALLPTSQAALLIWPTQIHADTKERSIALWVENQGRKEEVLQARGFIWHHKDGLDELEKQSSLIVSPPIAKIAPGKKQLFRIMNKVPVAANEVRSYRIILDEIPKKANQESAMEEQMNHGIKFQFRYSIPIFIYGQGLSNKDRQSMSVQKVISELKWKITQENGQNILSITNHGSYFVHLSNIQFKNNAGTESGIAGYILPKSTKKWILNTVPTSNHLYATLNGKEKIDIPK